MKFMKGSGGEGGVAEKVKWNRDLLRQPEQKIKKY